MSTRFLYSVVRYVPSPARGEFVNVGVVAGSDEVGEFSLRLSRLTQARARLVGGVLSELTAYLQPLVALADEAEWSVVRERAPGGQPKLNEKLLVKLSQDRRSSVQLSKPLPLLAESVEEALDLLDETFFPAIQHRTSGEPTKHTVKKSIRLALTRSQIEKDTGYREMMPVRWKKIPTKVDFTVSNGCVRALIQGFSLYQDDRDAVRNEVRSWAWMMGHLGREGGVMLDRREDKDVEIEIPKGVHAFAVIAAPPKASEATEDLLDEARRVIESEGAGFYSMGDADAVGAKAKLLLGSH